MSKGEGEGKPLSERWEDGLQRLIGELIARWESRKTIEVEAEALKKTGELKYRVAKLIERGGADPECLDIALQAIAYLEAMIAHRKQRREFARRRGGYYGGGREWRRRW